MRSTANDAYLNDSHPNEWAMDYKLNIPVHGQSVKATIDFPGAGIATIEATKLGIDQATSDPVYLCRECRAGGNGPRAWPRAIRR